MKRFRITLLVVCLLLCWLGYKDISLFMRNQEPLQVSIAELEANGARQEWLDIQGGYQDLLQAINMSGTIEIDAFLVPLKSSPGATDAQVWFETRDPAVLKLLKTYYFKLDSNLAREKFLTENREKFNSIRPLKGMVVGNLISNSNKNKLEKLLSEIGIPVSDRVVFISEGKEPEKWRGFFFAAIALLGLGKFVLGFKTKPGND